MAELQELFEITTEHVYPPQLDPWKEQEHRQVRARRTRRIGAVAVVAAIAVAVGIAVVASRPDPTAPVPAGQPTSASLHAIPADAVGVTGTADCSFSDGGVTPEGGPGGFLVSCELEMSDPRVSGTESHDRFRFYAGDTETEEAKASVWVAEDAVLTNDEGSWRGIAQAADDGTPCGEASYVGEGAYAGLEFHYYFCHIDDPVQLRGWISGGG